MGEGPPPLLGWCLAGFHVALLVSLALTGLYLAGAAGELLAGLETVVGLALYGYLWAVTWWTNRRWLATAGLVASHRPDRRVVLAEAVKWGGATGVLFLAAPLVVAAAFLVVGNGPDVLPFVGLVALVGTLLAATTGAVVGGLLATLDLLLVRASRVVLAPEAPEHTDTA